MKKPDHSLANETINATVRSGVVGFKGTQDIVRVDIETPKDSPNGWKVRTICIGADDSVIDVSEADSIIDLAAYLGREFAISRKYLMDRKDHYDTFDARMAYAENFSLEEDVKSGLLMQFTAGGVVYSVVRQGAYIVVRPNAEDRKFPALYTVYAQTEGEEDPDTAKILEESYDTQLEATMCIRNLIEKDLFQAFMPEACK